MGNKVIFEFNDCEENTLDIKLIVHRRQIYNSMYELSEYCRKLRKYEDRDANTNRGTSRKHQ